MMAVMADEQPLSRRMKLHPMLVPVPIGCWVASLIFDIASHVQAQPGFLTQGSTWLISIGVIGGLIAGAAGLVDAIPIPPGTPANRAAVIHLSLAAMTVIIAATDLFLRMGLPGDRPVPIGDMALSVVTVLVLIVAGYYGGTVVASVRRLRFSHVHSAEVDGVDRFGFR